MGSAETRRRFPKEAEEEEGRLAPKPSEEALQQRGLLQEVPRKSALIVKNACLHGTDGFQFKHVVWTRYAPYYNARLADGEAFTTKGPSAILQCRLSPHKAQDVEDVIHVRTKSKTSLYSLHAKVDTRRTSTRCNPFRQK